MEDKNLELSKISSEIPTLRERLASLGRLL